MFYVAVSLIRAAGMTMTPNSLPSAPSVTPATIGAYLILCLVWGSTYLGLRIAVETLPPWGMIAARSLMAGAVLTGLAAARGAAWPDRAQWRGAVVCGLLFFTLNQSVIAWAERSVPSGAAALLTCSASFFIPIVSWLTGASRRPNALALFGLLVGFAGVAVLLNPGGSHLDGVACLCILASCVAWALGTAFSRSLSAGIAPLLGSGLQLLAGGVGALVVSGLRGEWARLHPAAFSAASLLALGYLTVMGSLVAFVAYGWLIRRWPPERLSTYALINPPVALVLGAALAGERLGVREGLASLLILAAVALVMLSPRLRLRAPKAAMVPEAG